MELFICFSIDPDIPPNITIDSIEIDKVDSAKLLGVHISANLKWDKHIESIYSKAAARLYFLCMLKHAAVKSEDLVGIYVTILLPILEYACQVWHPGITEGHATTLGSIQRRALKIIFPDLSYETALEQTGLPTLEYRRIQMCKKLYTNMLDDSHKLYKLLPNVRENGYPVRNKLKYEPPKCKTERYKSTFVPYCLYNFQ